MDKLIIVLENVPQSIKENLWFWVILAVVIIVALYLQYRKNPNNTASQPAASQPAASQPAASQPAASQPAVTGFNINNQGATITTQTNIQSQHNQ